MAEKIKITTGELRKMQEEWIDLSGQIEALFSEMNEFMGRLEQFFVGKPAETVTGRQSSLQEQAEVSLRQLKSHLQKLTQIIQLYNQAEGENKNAITNN